MRIKNKQILWLFIPIFVILQIWCSSITFNNPYFGIYVELNQQHQWVIEELDQEGASSKLDVKVGDIIKLVDGKLPDESSYIQKWRVVEQAHTLLIARDGHEQEVKINTNSTTSYDIIPLLEEFVCLFMAVFLFMKMRSSSSARLLALFFLSTAIVYMSQGASVRGDVTGKILIASFIMLLPIVFLHFLIVFFKEKGHMELPTRILKYLYATVLITFVFRNMFFYFSMPSLYSYDGSVILVFFMIGFMINICVLAYLYFKERKQNSYLSSILRSVWLSLLLSFLPVICFSFLPKVIAGFWVIDAVYTSWIILLFPISFAYLIASTQLYDIGLVVRRFMFVGIISVVPVSLFTGAFAVLFRHTADERQILFVFVGSLILVSSMLYSTEYLTTRLEPFLFPRKFMLQSALKKISKNLGTISSFRELKEIVLVDIVGTLQVIGGAIVFQYKEGIEIIHEGEINVAEIEQLVSESSLSGHPHYTCMEMNRHEEYTSYLIMTRKKTSTLLGKEEIQWLSLITSYLAISLENVYLIRKLTGRLQQLASELPHESTAKDIQWFRKIMFELQEEERIRIATDLHDTTMQDLFFLKRRLVALVEKYMLSDDDQEQLSKLTNFVEMINTSLRQSCFELNPHLLKEVGLAQTLRMFLEKESYVTPFQLEFIAEKNSVIETKDLPTKRHIFRIVQELLNNAKKHSQASQVTFQIMDKYGKIYLAYEDDGVGFQYIEGVHQEIGASGMGLEQIRSRVVHLGGQIELLSRKDHGTKCTIIIPIEEVISA